MPHSFHAYKKAAKGRSVAGSLSRKGGRSMKRPSEELPGNAVAAPADQPAVQRYAFIKGEQLDPAQSKDEKVQSLAADRTIRDFRSEAELQSFASQQTDYIGNVGNENVWVRFKESGINLIGEDHGFITLKDVLAGVFALERGEWVYEGFTDMEDELHDRKEKKELHKTVKDVHEEHGLYNAYKISRDQEVEHAAESILPRIGYLLSLMLANGKKDGKTPGKKELSFEEIPQYNLEVMTSGLKYAWEHGKDVVSEVEQLKEEQGGCFCSGYKPPEKTKDLIKVIGKVSAQIGAFIEGMKYTTSLSDNLKAQGEDLHDSLVKFSEAMLDYLVFIKSQQNSGTSDGIRSKLQAAQTPGEKHEAFADLRNERFQKLVSSRKTSDEIFGKKAIRYAGMGANHLDAFKDSEWGDRKFDMQPGGYDYEKFKAHTEALKQKVSDAPEADGPAKPEEIKRKDPSKKKKKKVVEEKINEDDKPPRRKK